MTSVTHDTLSDQAARKAITTDLDSNYFVEAGAGSGKTANLVLRLLNLVLQKRVELANIAAITFTEAAAGELRNRLRSAFTEVAENGRFIAPGGEEIDYPDSADACQRALEALPGAAIGTLHSFCLRLIRSFPLEAKVPPEIRPVAELDAAASSFERIAEIEELINAVLNGDERSLHRIDELCEADMGVRFLEALDVLIQKGLKAENLRVLIAWLDEHWGELEATIAAPIPPESGMVPVEIISKALERLQEAASGCSPDKAMQDKLYTDYYLELIHQLKSCLSESNNTGFARPVFDSSSPGNRGSKKVWDDLVHARQEYKAVIANLSHNTNEIAQATMVVRHVLAQLALENARNRRTSGELEFNDMVYIADELVQHEHVRAELHKQYRHIFVDEFQDTDPAQYRIVTAITGNGGNPKPGSLFTVGDPKQSIYRFRRADIGTYMEARANADDSQLQVLDTNFRSAGGVLSPLNKLFEHLFENEQEDDGAPPISYVPLQVGHKAKGHAYFIDHREDITSDEEIDWAGIENEDIIDALRNVQAGTWSTDKRTLTLSDVTILVPTRNVAARIMDRLRNKEIPFVSEKTLGLFEAPEIMDLMQIIRAIGDPADKFAQAAAWRTAALGCSDNDLAKHALSVANQKADSSIVKAKSQLKTWRESSADSTVGELVRRVISDLKLDQAMIAWGRPESLARLRAFAEIADTYSSEVSGTIREFVDWVASETNGRSDFTEPVLDTGADGVKIMTIHNSKGREFPIVILAGMSSGINQQRGKAFIDRDSKIAELSLISDARKNWIGTPGFVRVDKLDKNGASNERIRLNYVAMTRAQNMIAVPLAMPLKEPHPSSAPKANYCGTEYLDYMITKNPEQFMKREEAFPTVEKKQATEPLQTVINESIGKLHEHQQQTLATANSLKPLVAATKLAHATEFEQSPDTLSPEEFSEEYSLYSTLLEDLHIPRDLSVPLGGRPLKSRGEQFGIAVHEAMEHLCETDALADLCHNVAISNGLEPTDDLKRAVESLSSSDAYQRASQAAEVYRELPVIGSVPTSDSKTVTLEGVIDLLYKDANGQYVIADFKTDAYPTKSHIEGYFRQLYFYKKLLPLHVARLELIFAREGKAEERVMELG